MKLGLFGGRREVENLGMNFCFVFLKIEKNVESGDWKVKSCAECWSLLAKSYCLMDWSGVTGITNISSHVLNPNYLATCANYI